ncbi:MAG: hypothetical protein RL189_183 [Pseudomonadota bacterium]
MNFRAGFALLFSPWTMLSCAVGTNDSLPNKIIGENDLTPVQQDTGNLPERLRPLIPAIGMLEAGCTVTHIGNGLVVTAGHCIPKHWLPMDGCLGDRYPRMSVRWNYLGAAEQAETSRSFCLRLLQSEVSNSHDYALLLVDNPPAAFVDVELNKRSPAGSEITLFGYPRKRPMEWSKFCVVVPFPDNFMPELSARERKNLFAHQCDTEQGNSGSPLIDLKTLELVGIHHGGYEPWNTASWVPASAISRAIRAARSALPSSGEK